MKHRSIIESTAELAIMVATISAMMSLPVIVVARHLAAQAEKNGIMSRER